MSLYLAIDIGNTFVKAAVFDQADLLEVFSFPVKEHETLHSIFTKYPVQKAIISDVSGAGKRMEDLLKGKIEYISLSSETPVPFEIEYATPHTLGMDRVAAVAGALHFFPQTTCLVIDAGTCITYDLLTREGKYLGGAISPGLHMRLRALHDYTGKLPEVLFEHPHQLIGDSTSSSILSGVFYGMTGEINAFIERYEEQFGQVQVLLCGGDTSVFDKHMKKNIFAAPFLVLYGLNKILSFNVNKGQ